MNNQKRNTNAPGATGIGIVIRSWLPEKKSCLIFDRSCGLIRGIICRPGSERYIQHGALVSYELSLRGERTFVDQVELRALPAPWAQADLAFIHHVLELCASFIPLNVADRQLFEHILGLYEPLIDEQDQVWIRLVFLAQFFLHIGWYPDGDTRAINRLISHVAGTMVTVREQDVMRRSLVRWLRRCVALHPSASSFKTVTFFEVVGYHET